MNRFARHSLLALSSAIALAACSSSTATPETLPATVGLEVHAVSGLNFDKSAFEATAGDIEVGYVNEDTIRHTLVVVDGDTKVGSFELQVNKRGDTDFGTINLPAGNYVLLCTVPGHQSMKADLTVK
ncbi:MAG: plastocyanin/azurin family copper-binding protein [Actinomycetes bacterium]